MLSREIPCLSAERWISTTIMYHDNIWMHGRRAWSTTIDQVEQTSYSRIYPAHRLCLTFNNVSGYPSQTGGAPAFEVLPPFSPVAAPEMAIVYTDDPERLAKAARLLPAKTGANVVLAEPYDPIVFSRCREANGVRSVSIAQAAIDCLTGPGRMPAEGEALLAWMRRNESRWRASSLSA